MYLETGTLFEGKRKWRVIYFQNSNIHKELLATKGQDRKKTVKTQSRTILLLCAWDVTIARPQCSGLTASHNTQFRDYAGCSHSCSVQVATPTCKRYWPS